MSDSIFTIYPVAPADISKPRYGSPIEHHIVRGLIRHLAKHGFNVHSIAVDGEYVETPDERTAVCEIFEWDNFVTLRFRQGDVGRLYGVLLVQGNLEDIISDYTDIAPFSDAVASFEVFS
jgi:predicted secreted protein